MAFPLLAATGANRNALERFEIPGTVAKSRVLSIGRCLRRGDKVMHAISGAATERKAFGLLVGTGFGSYRADVPSSIVDSMRLTLRPCGREPQRFAACHLTRHRENEILAGGHDWQS